jgi:hypothetical protein
VLLFNLLAFSLIAHRFLTRFHLLSKSAEMIINTPPPAAAPQHLQAGFQHTGPQHGDKGRPACHRIIIAGPL